MTPRLLCVVSVAATCVSRADAAIQYLTQSRSVQAETTFGTIMGTGPRADAPDFSTFQASVADRDFSYDASASASQVSSLLPDSISVSMLTSGTGGRQFSYGVGQSRLEVTFRLTVPSAFLLDWSFILGPQHNFSAGDSSTRATVRLSDTSSNTLYEWAQRPIEGYRTTGNLSASGSRLSIFSIYRLTVELTAGLYLHPINSAQFGDLQLRLTIPSPASSALLLPLALGLIRRRSPTT